jgi:hypothetical protein
MTAPDDSRVHALTRAGVAAALAVAREQGLPAENPRVLPSRGNLLVRLAPAAVVARVATLTAWTRRDPFACDRHAAPGAGNADSLHPRS